MRPPRVRHTSGTWETFAKWIDKWHHRRNSQLLKRARDKDIAKSEADVSLCGSIWAAITKYQSWAAYKQWEFICHGCGGRQTQDQGVGRLSVDKSSLPGSQTAFVLLCSHLVERAGQFCGVSLMRALIPLIRALPSRPKHLPKAPLPNIISLESWIQHINFRGIETFSLGHSRSRVLPYNLRTNGVLQISTDYGRSALLIILHWWTNLIQVLYLSLTFDFESPFAHCNLYELN